MTYEGSTHAEACEFMRLADMVRMYHRAGRRPTPAMMEHLNDARARYDRARAVDELVARYAREAVVRMPDGRVLTDKMIEQYAREAEAGYDVAKLVPRPRRSAA